MTEVPESEQRPDAPLEHPELRVAAIDRDGHAHEAVIAGCSSNTAVRWAAERHWRPTRVALARSWLCRPGPFEVPWSKDDHVSTAGDREPTSAPVDAAAAGATAGSPATSPTSALSSSEWLELADTLQDAMLDDVPLPDALRLLADDVPTRRARRTLLEVADALERGVPLAAALRSWPSRISREIAILAEAAENARAAPRPTAQSMSVDDASHSGAPPADQRMEAAAEKTLDRVLAQLIGDYVTQSVLTRSVTQEIWLSLPYPLAAVVGAALLFLFFSWMVLPTFADMFQGIGVELPTLTLFVLSAGELVRDHGLTLLAGIAAGIVAMVLVARLTLGEAFLVYCRDRIPLIGSIPRNLAYARFTSTLAGLIAAEIPLPSAVRAAARLSRNAAVLQSGMQLAERLDEGTPLPEATFQLHPPLHADVAATLACNEDRDGLVDALRTAAALFAAEARVQAAMLVVFLEPAIIVAVTGAIAVTVVSLLLPLMKLLNALA